MRLNDFRANLYERVQTCTKLYADLLRSVVGQVNQNRRASSPSRLLMTAHSGVGSAHGGCGRLRCGYDREGSVPGRVKGRAYICNRPLIVGEDFASMPNGAR